MSAFWAMYGLLRWTEVGEVDTKTTSGAGCVTGVQGMQGAACLSVETRSNW